MCRALDRYKAKGRGKSAVRNPGPNVMLVEAGGVGHLRPAADCYCVESSASSITVFRVSSISKDNRTMPLSLPRSSK